MSALGNISSQIMMRSQITQQLQQDLQNELSTANQLLRLISLELQQIKHLTNPGTDFEANIIQNTSLVKTLANMQQANIENLPPFARRQIDMSKDVSQTLPHEENSTFRNDSEMEETI